MSHSPQTPISQLHETLEPRTEPKEGEVTLKENNMDTPEHQSLYATGLEIRKRVVGEEYVANALEKGKNDFLRPLQKFATVRPQPSPLLPSLLVPIPDLDWVKESERS